MEFNVKINIDWIDEDSSIDDEIKKQIVQTVTAEVREATVSDVSKKVTDILESKVGELVTETYTKILNRQITITDKYGDVKAKYSGIKSMIKKRFDRWLTDKVDRNGNPSKGGYGGDKYSRFDWYIEKHLQPLSDKFTKEMVAKANNKLKATLTEDMKELLGTKILEVVNVKQLLDSAKSQ